MAGFLPEVEQTNSSRGYCCTPSHMPTHTNSLNLVLDVSMRNLWVGTQKQAVGRATGSPSPAELDQCHDSPDLAHRLPVVLEAHKVCYHYGNPCWEIKHVSEVLEHPLICHSTKPVYPNTFAGLKLPFLVRLP